MPKKKNVNIESPVFDAEGYQTNIKDINGEALPDLEALEWRPLHGGARPGAGRKPSGNKPVLLRLHPVTIQHLRAVAKKQKKTISEVAEERLAAV
ncbi:MAG: hypothetical protein LBK99_17090 [Opitutaceae bacterium]|jgi:hypothetical protein|nr:hypothetical protein [Opitutaceae bacterium]